MIRARQSVADILGSSGIEAYRSPESIGKYITPFDKQFDSRITSTLHGQIQWSQQAVQKAWPGRPVWRGLMPRIE
jgi:hypothetical protein